MEINQEYIVSGNHTDIFVHLPTEVRARQFKLSDQFLIEELFQIKIFELNDTQKTLTGDSHYVETLNGRRSLSEGDWLIKTPTGCYYVARKEHFDNLYVKKDSTFTNQVKDNKLDLIKMLENQNP